MSAVVDFPVRPEARPYLDAFAHRPSGEPEWLGARRRRGLTRFAEQGFPNRRSEAWRYLDLRALVAEPLLPAGATRGATPCAVPDEIGFPDAADRLALVDGRFAPELSKLADLPAGVWLGAMTTAIAARPELVRAAVAVPGQNGEEPIAALNGAFFTDGFVLDVAPGTVLDRPIEILHLASGEVAGSLHTRSLVALGEDSRIRLCESYAGSGRYWRNDVLTVRLGAGAGLDRTVLVEEAEDALHLALLGVDLGARARFESLVLLLRGRTLRSEAHVKSAGEGARCRLHGGFLAAG